MADAVFLLRLVVSLSFLGYAALRDIEEREVSDRVWLLSVPLCLALSLLGVFSGAVGVFDLAVSVAASLVLGLGLYYLGFYGGADSKALLLVAVAVPSFLLPSGSVLGFVVRVMFPVPFFLVFFASVALSALWPLGIFLLNIRDLLGGSDPLRGVVVGGWLRKLLLLASVRRISLGKLREGNGNYTVAERVVEDCGRPMRMPMYAVRIRDDDLEQIDETAKRGELYADGVLASPTIPMIVFISLGLAAGLLLMLL